MQNSFLYGWVPAVFSGKFLYPTAARASLVVEFSEPVTNFRMAFVTGEIVHWLPIIAGIIVGLMAVKSINR